MKISAEELRTLVLEAAAEAMEMIAAEGQTSASPAAP